MNTIAMGVGYLWIAGITAVALCLVAATVMNLARPRERSGRGHLTSDDGKGMVSSAPKLHRCRLCGPTTLPLGNDGHCVPCALAAREARANLSRGDVVNATAVEGTVAAAADRMEELERELAAARAELQAAKDFANAVECERLSLVDDLRASQLLEEFGEEQPHIYVDFAKGEYVLRRTFAKTFTSHKLAMTVLRELRALLNPAAQAVFNAHGRH